MRTEHGTPDDGIMWGNAVLNSLRVTANQEFREIETQLLQMHVNVLNESPKADAICSRVDWIDICRDGVAMHATSHAD